MAKSRKDWLTSDPEVVAKADQVGSTEYIIRALDAAEPGSAWAIGTELNLVRRLAQGLGGGAYALREGEENVFGVWLPVD